MKIQDVIKRVFDDTGIFVNRSRVYHYDAAGLLDNVERLDNDYRNFTEEDYEEFKLVVLLADSGIKLDTIKKMLTNEVSVKSVMQELKDKEQLLNQTKSLLKQYV